MFGLHAASDARCECGEKSCDHSLNADRSRETVDEEGGMIMLTGAGKQLMRRGGMIMLTGAGKQLMGRGDNADSSRETVDGEGG